MAKGQKYHIGPVNWPTWTRRFLNFLTLGEFNLAALSHDNGGEKNTTLTIGENDKRFYHDMDVVVDAQTNFFKKQWLRAFKHSFYIAVKSNPGYYEADEVVVKIRRELKSTLSELEEQRIEMDALRRDLYLKYEEVLEKQKEIESRGKVA